MALSKPNKIQILDENLEVIQNVVETTNQLDIDINGKYSMLAAIVGATGSGKSFLCNKLFNCKFDEKTSEQSSRVTVGGWLHYCRENNIFMFDSEGIGCEERSNQLHKDDDLSRRFDRTIFLFSLIISDVLLVNIECSQIGQSTGSCLGILETVTKECYEIFAQDQTKNKTIIICLRKFDEEEHSKESIIKRIEQKLKNQTDDSINFDITNFFNVEYSFIHCKYDEKLFNDDIEELRKTILKYQSNTINMLPINKLPELYKEYMLNIRTNAKFSISLTKIQFEFNYYISEIHNTKKKLIKELETLIEFYCDCGIIYNEAMNDFETKALKICNNEHSEDLYQKSKSKLIELITSELSKKYEELISTKRKILENKICKRIEALVLESNNYSFNGYKYTIQQLEEIERFVPDKILEKFGCVTLFNKHKQYLDEKIQKECRNYEDIVILIHKIKKNVKFCFQKYILIDLRKAFRRFKCSFAQKLILYFYNSMNIYLTRKKDEIEKCKLIDEDSLNAIFNKLRIDLFDWMNSELLKIDTVIRSTYLGLWLEHACKRFESRITEQKKKIFVITVTNEVTTDSSKIMDEIIQELKNYTCITIPIFDRENERISGRFRTKSLVNEEEYNSIVQKFIKYCEDKTNIVIDEIITKLRWKWAGIGLQVVGFGALTAATAGIGTIVAGAAIATESVVTAVTVARIAIASGSIISAGTGLVNVAIMKIWKSDGISNESKKQIPVICLIIPEFDIY